MEEEQKDVLLLTLNINLKLVNMDISCVNDINNLLLITMTETEKWFFYSSLESKLLEISENNYIFVETIISKSNLENKAYLLMRNKGINIMHNRSQYDIKEYVATALDTIYINITPSQEFNLYQILARLAIADGSPTLIKLTIDKIQLL